MQLALMLHDGWYFISLVSSLPDFIYDISDFLECTIIFIIIIYPSNNTIDIATYQHDSNKP